MPPFIKASMGVHALSAAAVLAWPATWPWALAAVAADHAVLTIAGLLPRSRLLGPNVTRLDDAAAARGDIALTFDDGPDAEVTPPLLDLLDRHGARATFFCIADRARSHAALLREIVARGHCVQNHTFTHTHRFSLLGPRGLQREVRAAQEALADACGQRPTCMRAPAGLRNPFLDPVLHRHGLRLVSWTRRGFDTRTRDADRVFARLARGLGGGDILLLHDGHAARTAQGGPVVLEVLPRLLARCRALGLRTVTLADALPRRGVPAA